MAESPRLVVPSYFVGLGGFSKAVLPHLDALLHTHYGVRPSCTPFTLFDFDGAGAGVRVKEAAYAIDPYLKELPKEVLLDYARKLRRNTKEVSQLREHLNGYVDFTHVRAVEAPGLNLFPQNGNLGWRLVWETHVLPELLSKLQLLHPAPAAQGQLERQGILAAGRSIIWVIAGGGSTTGPTGLIPMLCELKRHKPPQTSLFTVIFAPRSYRDRSHQQRMKGRAVYQATLEQLLRIFAAQGFDQPYGLDGYRIVLDEEPFDQAFLIDGSLSGGRSELQPDELAQLVALFLGKTTVGPVGERLLGILGNCTPSATVGQQSHERFDHLSTFGVAAAWFPARTIQAMLATRAQREMLNSLLEDRAPEGKTLGALPEPDLSRINFLESVRGEVRKRWQVLADEPDAVAPTQLLERLNQVWTAVEQVSGGSLQETVDPLFEERAQGKARIIEDEAVHLAEDRGLPAVIQWLESLQAECVAARQRVSQDLARYTARIRRQAEILEENKHAWNTLLGTEDGELELVPRRLLWLAAGVCTGAAGLWLLAIPWSSLIGIGGFLVAVLLGLHLSRPLFRHFRRSRELAVQASSLVSAYKSYSTISLDERLKRKEVEYYDHLQDRIAKLRAGYTDRLEALRAQALALAEREETLRHAIFEVPPTLKVLFREPGLDEWATRGAPALPRRSWIGRVCSLQGDLAWDVIDREALDAFGFLQKLRAEDELYELYPDRDARLAFLKSLREAVIGTAPGEGFLQLNFAEMAGQPPQIHLFVEVDDPTSSELAGELETEWASSAMGLHIQRTADPTMIAILGVVYGFPLAAQGDWPEIRTAFERLRAREGTGIYPILLPERHGES